MPNSSLTKRQGSGIVKLILAGMVSFLFLVGYVFYQSYSGRSDLVDSQRAGCERGKLDRRDNADFQRAQNAYILKVTGAASVKEDVKKAAREAQVTFNRTSTSLDLRSKIDCNSAFPKAGLIP